MNKIRCLRMFLLILFLVGTFSLFSQSRYQRNAENYFGLEFRPLIPFGMVGDQAFELKNDGFISDISPAFGYSYGGIVRIGFTELLALETGLSYIRRNYHVDYTLVDSNIVGEDNIGYISFNLPIKFLVYVKLADKFYMNASAGASTSFNPSNVSSSINPEGAHSFVFEGRRMHFFDFSAEAEVGFEFRTPKAGIFYLGIAGRIPFSSTLRIATEYRKDTHSQVSYGEINGATFALTLRYFFHNTKRKKGPQFIEGPIEQ